VTPEQVLRDTQSGQILPVYLVVGEERVFIDRVVQAIRVAALQGGVPDFDQDVYTAAESSIESVISAVRTVPMMAPRRLVIVRALERWETTATPTKAKSTKDAALQPMDRLAAYIQDPIDSSCLLLIASKLDKRRKLVSTAKKKGYLVECDPVTRQALPRFISQEASLRGHKIAHDVAEVLAEIAGPELAPVLDAIERLSLYVGEKGPITTEDVAVCVTRIRPESVWSLVGAVARKDAATALSVLHDVYDPQDRGLRLVGVLAWSTRQLLRFAIAFGQGASAEQAAGAAGPSFQGPGIGTTGQRVESW
jgi:DNA polymerase-3 subunit delta